MSFNASLMNKATTSDPAPTAGYLFEEIAKMTHISFDVNAKVVSFVQTRLQNKTSHVKWKTLLMVKYVASKGAPAFKQALQRQLMGDLKQCLSFTGPPDVLRQDEYNARVRTAAAGALEAVTADDRATGGRMAGLGSDSFSSNASNNPNSGGGGGGGSSSSGGGPVPFNNNNTGTAGYANNSGRMQGIGSSPWDPNAKKETFGSSALSAARSAASKLVYAAGTPEQRNMAYGGGASGGGDFSNSYASNRGGNAYGQSNWQPTPGYSGNSGGGGGNGGAAAVNWGSGGSTGNNANANSTPAAPSSSSSSSVGGHGGMGGGADDGAYERGLIAELCVPGGARAVPPADALAKFLELAPSLDSELVGPCLLETFSMPDVPWQARSKALAVGLALVKKGNDNTDSSSPSSPHAAWFRANAADDLEAMANDATMKPASLATKARDLLVALGLRAGSTSGGGGHSAVSAVSTSLGATAAAPGGEMDLLGTFEEPPPPSPVASNNQPPAPLTPTVPPAMVLPSQPVAATPSPAKASGVGGSLFGSLAVKPSPTAAATPASSLESNTTLSETSLLSALSLNENSSSSGGSTANATAAASASALSGAAPAPVHDPFGLSDLSPSWSAPSTAPPPVPAPSASPDQETGFDFMSGGGRQQQQQPMPGPSSLMPTDQPPQQIPAYGQQLPMGVGGGIGYAPQGGMGYQQQQQQQQQPPMGMDAAALYQQNMYLMQQMQQNQMLMQQQQMSPQQQQHMQQPLMPQQGNGMMMPTPPMQPQGNGNGSSAFDFMGSGGGVGGFSSGGAGSGNSSSGGAVGSAKEDAFSFVKDSMQAK